MTRKDSALPCAMFLHRFASPFRERSQAKRRVRVSGV